MTIRAIPEKYVWQAAIVVCLLFGCHGAFAAETTCRIADQAIGSASDIRGLRIKRNVPCLVHTREQVKEYLIKTIDEKIPAQKLEMEEYVYKALGIVPAEFKYKEGIIDMYLSMIGGYYDPEVEHFVMAGWLPAEFQTTIAVHELTHALQDQYYGLDKFLDHTLPNTDELLARSALIEGDATAVMIDYGRQLVGQGGIAEEEDVNAFLWQNVIGVSLMGGAAHVPEGLKLMLIFPYTSGLRFNHALLRKGGYKEINKVYKRPPRSSEEIFHPEIYLKKKQSFITFGPQDVKSEWIESELKPIYEDTLGEFGISILLAALTGEKKKASQAASGWGGDRVFVYESSTGQKVLHWKMHWDTEKDKTEFINLFREGMERRYSSSFENVGDQQVISQKGVTLRFAHDGEFVNFEYQAG